MEQNKLAEAESLLREALEIRRVVLPTGHPDTDASLKNLADLCARQGNTSEAGPLLSEAIELTRATLPKDSPQLAVRLATASGTRLVLREWDESALLFREAIAISEKEEPDRWTTFNTKSMLGGALCGQKQYAESEPLLLDGYDGLRQRETTIPPHGKVRFPEAIERLVQLYTDWHAAEPDQGYDAKAAEWQTKLNEHKAAEASTTQTGAPGN